MKKYNKIVCINFRNVKEFFSNNTLPYLRGHHIKNTKIDKRKLTEVFTKYQVNNVIRAIFGLPLLSYNLDIKNNPDFINEFSDDEKYLLEKAENSYFVLNNKRVPNMNFMMGRPHFYNSNPKPQTITWREYFEKIRYIYEMVDNRVKKNFPDYVNNIDGLMDHLSNSIKSLVLDFLKKHDDNIDDDISILNLSLHDSVMSIRGIIENDTSLGDGFKNDIENIINPNSIKLPLVPLINIFTKFEEDMGITISDGYRNVFGLVNTKVCKYVSHEVELYIPMNDDEFEYFINTPNTIKLMGGIGNYIGSVSEKDFNKSRYKRVGDIPIEMDTFKESYRKFYKKNK